MAQGPVRALPDQLGIAARPHSREHVRGPGRRRLPLGRPLEESVAGAPLLGPEPDRGRRRRPPRPGRRLAGRELAAPGLVAPAPPRGRRARLRPPRGPAAPPHPAPARSPVRGDHLLQPRAGEEVRRARDADRAAVAPHRSQRRGERDARPGEDLRPGAEPARPPDAVRAGLPAPGGPRAPRAPRAPLRGGRPRGAPVRGRRASASRRRRARARGPRSPGSRCSSATWRRRPSRCTTR